MATWAEFETAVPEMAACAARLWPGITELQGYAGPPRSPQPGTFSIAYLATIRRDGGPRLHPFCPILAAGRLYAAIPPSSPKGHDLRRDARCVIHALPGPQDDEFGIRAMATEVTDDRDARAQVVRTVAASGIGGMIETASLDPLFEFDLVQVDVARWLDIGQPGTRPVRQRWRPR